jgi:hypothetical protein
MDDDKKIAVMPTCKYGHGALELAAGPDPVRWAYNDAAGRGWSFTGNLFLCSRCGYTEFFDDTYSQLNRLGERA